MEINIVPFRELTVHELHDIMHLRFHVFCLEQHCLYEEFDGNDTGAYHVLLKDEGQIVGTARFFEKPEVVYFGRIALQPAYRGKHLGQKMVGEMLAFAAETFPLLDVELSAQTYLRGFYESLGFTIESAYYSDECGIEHVDMKRRTK